MEQTLTLVCKLQPTPEQVAKLQATLQAFSDACNYVNASTPATLNNKIALQALTYQTIKAEFNLVANMAVRVCARVAANRKTAKQKGKPVKGFKPTSMDLDKDLFRFREQDWTVSLATVQGRERVKLQVGNYQRGKLKGRNPTSGQLCLHRDGHLYLHIHLTDEAPEPARVDNVIGVDFGRRDIAVTSEGERWDGKDIQNVRDKFARVRKALQHKASKGTRTTRRRCREILKRLSGRERRYQSWLNHTISRRIIDTAKTSGSIVAIEDLAGIRDRTNQQPRSKTERRRSNSWAFYQLRQFLEYKGIQAGVKVVAIPPAYTSQTCHCCLHLGLRSGKSFKCANHACHWSGDADLNGASVIKLWGRSVNRPGGSDLVCSLNRDDSGLLKAVCFS